MIDMFTRHIQRIPDQNLEVLFSNYTLLAASIIREFILIHPYIDGNGHISRGIPCALLISLG